ncbi:MAG: amino acid permease [Planctomycetes bacterium]|nr:amino acid permease [Planctomycetota bacterium]
MAHGDSPESQPPDSPSTRQFHELPRVLGLFDAVTVVVGSIIGSGIFLSKVGRVAEQLHAFGPIIGVWIGVGVVTLCGALAVAELAAMHPRAGGPYLYLREAYGPLPAFLWGWSEFWVIRTGSIAALACATVIYLDKFLEQIHPLPPSLHPWLAGAIVVGLSAINYFSTRWGATVQNVTTVLKVGFLIAIIVLPVMLGKAAVSNLEPIWPTAAEPSYWKALGIAIVAVLWPYDGWINIAPVAEEIRDPQRNVPRGLALGMLVVILVYVGANVGYHLTLPMSHLAASEIDPVTGQPGPTSTVASDLFGVMFGKYGMQFAALGVMCSTFGAVNSNLFTGPRIYFAMARDGLLHPRLHAVHATYQTPGNAILLQAGWTTALIAFFFYKYPNPRESFEAMTDSVIFAGLIFYGLTVAAVYVLRRTRPDLPRPYRTWGYPVTPALMLLVYVAAAATILGERPSETMYVVGLIGAGVIYYLIVTRIIAARAARRP